MQVASQRVVNSKTLLAAAETQAAAFGIAALSSFFNGSFPACQRIPKGPPLDPVLFNGLVCVGVFLSSLLIPLLFSQDGGAREELVFTAPGAIGGVLFVFAALFSFVAIPRAGLATAQAVWSLDGSEWQRHFLATPRDSVHLEFGALIIVNCDSIAYRLSGTAPPSDANSSSASVAGMLAEPFRWEDDQYHCQKLDRTAGIASALAVGVFGGSVLATWSRVKPSAVVEQGDATRIHEVTPTGQRS
eukprot:Skav208266  [mRNA]  locus=scaffold188:200187:203627:+ [translate_table: standard]